MRLATAHRTQPNVDRRRTQSFRSALPLTPSATDNVSWIARLVVAVGVAGASAILTSPSPVQVRAVANPLPASFDLGPLVGSVTQTWSGIHGTVSEARIWYRFRQSDGGAAQIGFRLKAAETSAPAGAPASLVLREATVAAPQTGAYAPLTFAFAPVELDRAHRYALEVVRTDFESGELFLAATRNDVFDNGRMLRAQGPTWPDQDLVFEVPQALGRVELFAALWSHDPWELTFRAAGILASVIVVALAAGHMLRSLPQWRGRSLNRAAAFGVMVAIGAAMPRLALLYAAWQSDLRILPYTHIEHLLDGFGLVAAAAAMAGLVTWTARAVRK